jgi:membrane protein DedA with SNARE-associated domain
MREIWAFALRHGDLLLGVVVFLEQAGLPLPAIPVLLVMGALAGAGHASIAQSLLVAVVAAVSADLIWYELGRRRGDRILGLLCRLSLEPDTCVRKTSESFERWGPLTLLFAKYVPGLSTVAPPLAGSAGVGRARFLWCDTMGSVFWAGPMLALGYLFRQEAEPVMAGVASFGTGLAGTLAVSLAGWVTFKWRQRQKALRQMRIPRITPAALAESLSAEERPVVVDLRPAREIRRSGGRVPTARAMKAGEVELNLRDLPRGAHLVFYCS